MPRGDADGNTFRQQRIRDGATNAFSTTRDDCGFVCEVHFYGVRRQSAAATALWIAKPLDFFYQTNSTTNETRAPSPLRSAGARQIISASRAAFHSQSSDSPYPSMLSSPGRRKIRTDSLCRRDIAQVA